MQHIHYAKSKSYATLRLEDPNFVPPNTANASSLLTQSGKRQRDGETGGDRPPKREKGDGSDEEMEIEEDEESQQKDTSTSYSDIIVLLHNIQFPSAAASISSPQVHQPSARLLCQNLPQEVTDDVLSVLFQQ